MTLRDWAQTETPKPVIATLEQPKQLRHMADYETTQNHFNDLFLGTPVHVPDPTFFAGDGWVLEFPDGVEQATFLRLQPVYGGKHTVMEARIEHNNNPAKCTEWREFSSRADLGILLEIFSGPPF